MQRHRRACSAGAHPMKSGARRTGQATQSPLAPRCPGNPPWVLADHRASSAQIPATLLTGDALPVCMLPGGLLAAARTTWTKGDTAIEEEETVFQTTDPSGLPRVHGWPVGLKAIVPGCKRQQDGSPPLKELVGGDHGLALAAANSSVRP